MISYYVWKIKFNVININLITKAFNVFYFPINNCLVYKFNLARIILLVLSFNLKKKQVVLVSLLTILFNYFKNI